MIPVYVIGDTTRSDFQPLLQRLSTCQSCQIIARFSAIPQALAALNAASSPMPLTIVLQSTPQQYAQPDVDQLVAQTILSSLVCSYGPWCESDGRSAQIWPTAIRVAAREAPEIIVQHIESLRQGVALPSPLCAMEDVFASRNTAWKLPGPTDVHTSATALVLCPDRRFRDTVTVAFQRMGLPATGADLLHGHTLDFEPTASANVVGRMAPHIIVMDLDSSSELVSAALKRTATRFPDALRLGITWRIDMQIKGIDSSMLDGVLPRLSFLPGLAAAVQQLG